MSKHQSVLYQILKAVSEETEISSEKILSRNSGMEVVYARWISVKLLYEYGFYTNRIAECMRITPRYVQYILTNFEDRILISKLMRNSYERIKTTLRNINETNSF